MSDRGTQWHAKRLQHARKLDRPSFRQNGDKQTEREREREHEQERGRERERDRDRETELCSHSCHQPFVGTPGVEEVCPPEESLTSTEEN